MIWLIQRILICNLGSSSTSSPYAQVRDSYAGSMRQGWFFGSETMKTKDNHPIVDDLDLKRSIIDYDYTWLHYRSIH